MHEKRLRGIKYVQYVQIKIRSVRAINDNEIIHVRDQMCLVPDVAKEAGMKRMESIPSYNTFSERNA